LVRDTYFPDTGELFDTSSTTCLLISCGNIGRSREVEARNWEIEGQEAKEREAGGFTGETAGRLKLDWNFYDL
jgi:hypothetical protein